MKIYTVCLLRSLLLLSWVLGSVIWSGAHAQSGCMTTFSDSNRTHCLNDSYFFSPNTGKDTTVSYYRVYWGNGDSVAYDSTWSSSQLRYTYSSADTFTVRLVIERLRTGCTDTDSVDVVVHPLPPKPQFTFTPDSVCSDTAIAFTTRNGSSSYRYQWRFGDGSSSKQRNPTHLYRETGNGVQTRMCSLTFTDGKGCTNTHTKQVSIKRLPKKGDFDLNGNLQDCNSTVANPRQTVNLRSTLSNYIDSFTFSGLDTSWTASRNGASLSKSVDTLGIYAIQLKAYGQNGCTQSKRISYINETSPSVSITLPSGATACAPGDITFSTSPNDVSPTTRFAWIFGDGDTLIWNYQDFINAYDSATSKASYTHTYTETSCGVNRFRFPSSYQVEILALNACKTRISNPAARATAGPIRIAEGPDAEFLFKDTIVCHPDTAFIYNTTDENCLNDSNLTNIHGGYVFYDWDFGNNRTAFSTKKDTQSVYYAQSGRYIVELRAENDCDTTYHYDTLTVDTPPQARFRLQSQDPNRCIPFSLVSTNTSTGSRLKYKWTYSGQGGSITPHDSAATPTFRLDRLDAERITLKASNYCGLDSADTTIYPRSKPVCTLPRDTDYCGPQKLSFSPKNTNHQPAYDSSRGAIKAYRWSVDGPVGGSRFVGSSTDTFTTIAFSQAGVYKVHLQARNICGWSDTATQEVVIYELPQASTGPDTMICHEDSVMLRGSARGGTAPYRFRWLNPTVLRSDTSVTSTQGLIQTDTFRLVVTDKEKCRDTSVQMVRVNPSLRVSLVQPQLICFEDSARLRATGQGGTLPYRYNWTPSKLIARAAGDSALTKALQGDTVVSITLVDSLGCQAVDSGTQDVNPPLQVSVSSRGFTCYDDSVKLKSTTSSTGALSYSWSPSGLVKNPAQAQTWSQKLTRGQKFVLKVTDTNRCEAQDADSVMVNPALSLDVGNDTTICFGDRMRVAPSYGGGTAPYSFQWFIADSLLNPQQDTTQTRRLRTSQYLRLRLQDDSACVAQDSLRVQVPSPLVAHAGGTKTFCDSMLTLGGSPAAKGGIGSYRYNWSPGTSLSDSTVGQPVLPQLQQTQTFTLLVSDQIGCTDTDQVVIHEPMSLQAAGDTTWCGAALQVGRAQPVSGGDGSYIFSWSPSARVDDAGKGQPQLVGPFPQKDSLFLSVSDGNGCSVKDTIMIYPQVRASAGSDTVLCLDSIQLGDAPNAQGGSGNYSFSWLKATALLNDTALPNPWISNLAQDTMLVLRVEDDENCAAYDTIQIAGPLSVQYPEQLFICEDDTVLIQPISIQGGRSPRQYQWSPSYRLQNPTRDTAAVSPQIDTSYVVVVQDSFGCRRSDTSRIMVHPRPVADFQVDPVCFGDTSFFVNQTTIARDSIKRWSWDFGDTSSSDTADRFEPSYVYSQPDSTYTVRLTAVSDSGCADTVHQNARVLDAPRADFQADSVCFPDSLALINTSTIPCGQVDTWQWSLGDSNQPSDSNVVHAYNAPGVYAVTLTLTMKNGVKDRHTDTVVVYPKPMASFDVASICLGDTALFANNSRVDTIGPSRLTQFFWDFGNGVQQTIKQPGYAYRDTGVFLAELIVASNRGCRDTTTETLWVHPNPVADFTVADACFGDTSFFVNQTTIARDSIKRWSWDFGDTSSSDTADRFEPSYVYSQPDSTYTVRLTAVSDSGCADTVHQNARVLDAPRADFQADSVCFPDSLALINTSTIPCGQVDTWQWSLGDSNQPSDSNVVHAYNAPGVYAVTLTLTMKNGVKDRHTDTVVVYPKPMASFDVASICLGDTALFANNSRVDTIGPSRLTQFIWDFGNGVQQTIKQPGYAYQDTGVFLPELIVASNRGCRDTTTETLWVNPNPEPSFSVNDVCLGDTSIFVDSSRISRGTIQSRFWNFGDGNTDTVQNPRHYYSRSGQYIVRLTTRSDSQCTASVSDTAVVLEGPVADFDYQNVCFPEPVNFADASQISCGKIQSWLWDFGDGDTSRTANPTHRYARAGVYDVGLIITMDNQFQDTVVKRIAVNPRPQSAFQQGSLCLGDTLRPKDQSQVTNPSGISSRLVAWKWKFGNGDSSTNRTAPYVYQDTGKYSLSLIVRTDSGCTDTSRQFIDVNPNPSAQFQVDSGCFGDTLTFFNQSTIDRGRVVRFKWLFGNGDSSRQDTAQYRYPAPGDYRILLIAGSDSGCVDTASRTLEVADAPVAGFEANDVCFPEPVLFRDTSRIRCGKIIRYQWNFGDGDSSGLADPQHRYAREDTYTVRLIITLDNGYRDTVFQNVVVHPKPSVAFTTANVCRADSAPFINTSQISAGRIQSWQWDFGDQSSSRRRAPGHLYQQYGSYQVQLIGTSDQGCRDTASGSIVVHPMPEPDFTVPRICFQDSAPFTNQSRIAQGRIIDYAWRLGDGDSSSQVSPIHYYARADTYQVQLKVRSDSGCISDTQKSLIVDPKPVAAFGIDTLGCVDQAISIRQNSTQTDAYTWDMGNGDTVNGAVPGYAYRDTGYFRITLFAGNAFGCRDTLAKDIEIIDLPRADFTLEPDSGCAPLEVSFKQRSRGKYLRYTWRFGNGSDTTAAQPQSVIYAQSRYQDTTYYVTMDVENVCGIRSDRDSVLVKPRPIAGIATSLDSGCTPLSVRARSTSLGLPQQFRWSFGDGASQFVSDSVVDYVYTTDSTTQNYPLQLVAINDCGTDTATQLIRVKPNIVKAFFEAEPLEGCAPMEVQIEDGSVNTTFVSYGFGDGNLSSNANPDHRYNRPGAYTLSQYATNGCGYDTLQVEVRVFPEPEVDFTLSDRRVCAQDSVVFTNNSQGDAGGTWYFGDGDSSMQRNPVHQYVDAGWFRVRFRTLSEAHGCLGEAVDSLLVQPLPDVAFSMDSSQGCPPFTPQLQNETQGARFYEWYFDSLFTTDGEAGPDYTFKQPGPHTITLRAETEAGCASQLEKRINVYPVPRSDFQLVQAWSCDTPARVQAINTSQRAIAYTWRVQTRTLSRDIDLDKEVSEFGNYPISLITRNRYRCRDTSTRSYRVIPNPQVQTDTNYFEACVPFELRRESTSQFADSIIWDIQDSVQRTGPNIRVRFTDAQQVDARLIAWNQGRCVDTLDIENWFLLHPKPDVAFRWTDTLVEGRRAGAIQFINESRPRALSYQWSFGDGATDTTIHPRHRFIDNAGYPTQLIGTTDNGCSDTAEARIEPQKRYRLFVPNALAPVHGNGDSRVFLPKGNGLDSLHVRIYDAWGKLLWSSTSIERGQPAEAWDGRMPDGRIAKEDAYIWKIYARFKNGEVWKGQRRDGAYYRIGTVNLIK